VGSRLVLQLVIPTNFYRLLVSTVLVAICAEFLVSSIDGMVAGSGISETFVGLILLPIVGNAAEVLPPHPPRFII
jgi:Ca2+:H+ antiporter